MKSLNVEGYTATPSPYVQDHCCEILSYLEALRSLSSHFVCIPIAEFRYSEL